MEDHARPRSPADQNPLDADRRLLAQIRAGDVEAGHRFVREHYAAIYRYLIHLTGQPEMAEDLTQETFLQGWRRLETFQGRGSLRSWLYRIAHREFLRLLQRRQAEPGLDRVPAERGWAELAAPDAAARLESVELRAVIDRLSLEQREVVLLYYLEGYSSTEIARIVEAPVGTVCSRLARAREHLRQELDEDDLAYLNEPLAPGTRAAGGRQWAWLPLDQMHTLETRLTLGSDTQKEGSPMERREFLRQAAVGAAGLMLTEPEKEVIDSRLTQKVTCAFKGTALADLCEKLKADAGIPVTAGPSVADEKLTLFCEKMPLREVMRQLSRPFGYTWLRNGTPGGYRYELVQDLRSQLLEEELRNRDRNEALLALEAEIDKYRPYLSLSPDEVLARAQTAPPAEKKVLESLGGGHPGPGLAWGVTQMYFRLTPQQLAALRAGEELRFSQGHVSGDLRSWDQPLPPNVGRGVLQSLRTLQLVKTPDGYSQADEEDPRGLPLTAVPEAGALLSIKLKQSELGQFGLDGMVGYSVPGYWHLKDRGPYAVGVSPKTLQLENAVLNAKFAQDPALQRPVTLSDSGLPAKSRTPDRETPSPDQSKIQNPKSKITTADVLEALHRATGMPIVADFYTHLYAPEAVTLPNRPLFDALNQLCDTMRLRWNKEGGERDAGSWLQFRSMTCYHDRLKEVPNRFLTRWSTARRERGLLTLEELVEISQLPDAQLKGADMAEGARECWGLQEWDLARDWVVLANLRFLAQLTPAQRQEAQRTSGLRFAKLSLAQQQAFFNRGVSLQPDIHSLEELAGAALRVDYTQPGWFEWGPPQNQTLRWAVRSAPGAEAKWLHVPAVQARTRDAALQALRQTEPQIRAAVRAIALAAAGRTVVPAALALPAEEEQIVPTQLNLVTILIPGSAKSRLAYWARDEQGYSELSSISIDTFALWPFTRTT